MFKKSPPPFFEEIPLYIASPANQDRANRIDRFATAPLMAGFRATCPAVGDGKTCPGGSGRDGNMLFSNESVADICCCGGGAAGGANAFGARVFAADFIGSGGGGCI